MRNPYSLYLHVQAEVLWPAQLLSIHVNLNEPLEAMWSLGLSEHVRHAVPSQCTKQEDIAQT